MSFMLIFYAEEILLLYHMLVCLQLFKLSCGMGIVKLAYATRPNNGLDID